MAQIDAIINLPVEVATEAAMLSSNRGSGHDLDKDTVGGHPDAEEGVHVHGGAPLEDPEIRNGVELSLELTPD